MVFLIDKVDSEHQVVIYENIPDLVQRVEWQDIFEGKSIIIYENGIEYEWDSTKKNEIGTVHDYSIVPTSKISALTSKCLEIVSSNPNICEFNL